jgi:hypothetical protein
MTTEAIIMDIHAPNVSNMSRPLKADNEMISLALVVGVVIVQGCFALRSTGLRGRLREHEVVKRNERRAEP